MCETDGSGNVTAGNTWGTNGLLARHTTSSVFYAFDPQGSVSIRLDSGGNVLSSHCNDAWGTQVSTGAGYASDPYAGYGGQWGYYRDSETGLHLLGHRYYDASSGRFLNRDPLGYGGGVNMYGYCGSSPVRGIDPTGLQIQQLIQNVAESVEENPLLQQALSDDVQELAQACETVVHNIADQSGPSLGIQEGIDRMINDPVIGIVRHHTDPGGLIGIQNGGGGYPQTSYIPL